jgi:hypothetical protein
MELIKLIITIPKDKYHYIQKLKQGDTDYATTRMLYHAIKVSKEALQQEPKTGHWIRVDKDKLRCSECEVIHLIAQYPNGKIDWCPNCGAKMAEGSEANESI